MERDRRTSLIVGAFVLVVLAIFAAVVLSLSAERGFWQPRYQLVAHFLSAEGLIAGAPVRLAGKDVGIVGQVSFEPLGARQPPVRVILQIDRSVQDRIRTDSVATIGTIGLLGDKYVEISMGTQQASVLPAGGSLPGHTPPDVADVMEKGTQALDNIAQLTANVNQVVQQFGAKTGGKRLAESVEAFTQIVQQIQEGHGLLHSLIYEQYKGRGVESIERSLADLEDILGEVKTGKGVLHGLIYEPTQADSIAQALDAAAQLNRILKKVNRGEGTLGLMVNDPSLYYQLQRLLGGAQRSFVVRTLIHLSTSDENGQ